MMDWHTLLSLYPFTPSETMHILGELAIALYALFALKDWNKLKTLAEVEALKLINETLSKEEKRNKVISYTTHSNLPPPPPPPLIILLFSIVV